MKFVLYGNPIPLARHRTANGRTYDPQKALKNGLHWDLLAQAPKCKSLSGPLELHITFFMPIPKSLSSKKYDALLLTPHYKKPDLSNLIKFYEDICNGLIYKDDAQIVSISAKKLYDSEPRTEFKLTEITIGK